MPSMNRCLLYIYIYIFRRQRFISIVDDFPDLKVGDVGMSGKHRWRVAFDAFLSVMSDRESRVARLVTQAGFPSISNGLDREES